MKRNISTRVELLLKITCFVSLISFFHSIICTKSPKLFLNHANIIKWIFVIISYRSERSQTIQEWGWIVEPTVIIILVLSVFSTPDYPDTKRLWSTKLAIMFSLLSKSYFRLESEEDILLSKARFMA